ncbi:phytanoyl-CoA dioxygenase family protein [Dactylosporangium sp. NBC_01737]|uniref:phytanoyl-CoA dioxygenase family protein n=1 Tax=Dactylosporangium sp. NBC_01737 TaxID=2975959 RepID=UPI002E138422|nr:phytanoyl-CoA dioxygenase family protein [Dactylosporangium sp. NBC_01737]
MSGTDTLTTEGPGTLGPDGVARFWREGFAGPFPLGLPDKELAELADRCERIVEERHIQPLYGRYALRDWHLVDRDLERVFTQETIIGRVAELLGPDLLLWRSKIFYKPPGADAIGWHQEWGKFDGEEIGNSTPSLQPAGSGDDVWDLTVWVALDDVTPENGPLQFATGTNTTKVPWVKVPMTQSAFYEEPFVGLTKEQVAERTRRSELVLDIDTANWLDGYDVDAAGLDELTAYLHGRFDELLAKFTDFEPAPGTIATMVMPRGSFVIFSERTMHGSPPNNSDRRRMAVNCRLTRADTLVYPGRLTGTVIDGSNLDISKHESLLVAGRPTEARNVIRN